MRTIFLPQSARSVAALSLRSGPGSPIFEPGPQTRIYRAPVRAIGVAVTNEGEGWGQVLDISLGGCLFKTDDPLDVGAQIQLRITIIGTGHRAVADVRGVVCRVGEDGERPAYGVEFRPENSKERQKLQWLYSQALR